MRKNNNKNKNNRFFDLYHEQISQNLVIIAKLITK